jgi:hypothetical protein
MNRQTLFLKLKELNFLLKLYTDYLVQIINRQRFA